MLKINFASMYNINERQEFRNILGCPLGTLGGAPVKPQLFLAEC